ncbi:CAP domain-containing protein [Gracilibacillus sp. S3-1-1]|uniref:CAP domain-containing protein n=1 Tax=Gracilibacillus pellucidus TaxID=3095368 RepID=A0ACC6M1U0_9BACI|nr:CAP domain-containing protein [Gracilibacillus sp. S3-1-1]MDX8044906.1 CAP domain-containing protein [Gracilibacillus sp. S3-1-1]
MRLKIIAFIILVSALVFSYLFYVNKPEEQQLVHYHQSPAEVKNEKVYIDEEHTLIAQQDAIWKFVGRKVEEFELLYGEPVRKDTSLYGYDWWIYNDDDVYVQIAVQDDVIISMYSNSDNLDFSPLTIGQEREEIKEIYSLQDEIEFEHLRFKLTENDLLERPIVQLTEELFAQLYIDQFTEKLAGIRIVNKEVLELIRPYELFYWGEVKELVEPNKEEWEEVESGLEQQIFDLTNEVRRLYDVGELVWDEDSHHAAKTHSEDMYTENYFSHYSLNGDGLKERLLAANAHYLSAGENIAAHYIDAPAVIHGWLNSEGHREALLKAEYTHLGVGVYQSFFTQNFIEK